MMSADLRGADLRGADLSHTNLHGADLTGADLTGAILLDTNLRAAQVADVHWPSSGQAGAHFTELPGGVAVETELSYPP